VTNRSHGSSDVDRFMLHSWPSAQYSVLSNVFAEVKESLVVVGHSEEGQGSPGKPPRWPSSSSLLGSLLGPAGSWGLWFPNGNIYEPEVENHSPSRVVQEL
jgi:hypothetical protein